MKETRFVVRAAFNLLMGRAWPPSEEDLEEAEAIAEELGLSEVFRQMPAGYGQTIGETGWRLSSGERALVGLGRCLLHRPEVLIVDESLGTLDPLTAGRVLETLKRRVPTLVLISHG